MLRSHRRLLWALRRNFSARVEEPEPKREPKRVTKFDPKKTEVFMQDILDRELPLLRLDEEKAERPPFLEQIFQKNFDERFLTYPEVLESARITNINALYQKVKSYVDSLPPDCMENGPSTDVMQGLKALDVFKILTPYSERGLGLTMTEMARIIEAFAFYPSLGSIIATHTVAGIRTISNFAPDSLRSKYLPPLVDGKPIAAFAIDEDTFGESKTTATIEDDECIINGKKIFVKNGKNAEVFVLICKFQGDGESGQASILVDRNLEGVVIEDSPETHGLKGNGLSTIHFKNVRVPKECILGSAGKRTELAENIAANVRIALSAVAIGPCREAFNEAFRYTFTNERFNQLICRFQLIQEQICRMALDVFTMESCVYFFLAIEDVVQDPKHTMESIATALTCLEYSERVLNQSADIFGARGKRLEHNSTRWLDDIVTSPFFFASPREHSMSLARMGLRATARNVTHDGKAGGAIVPHTSSVSFPMKFFADKFTAKNQPTTHGTLYQFLHPSLIKSANILDFIQRNFGEVCERLVQRFGEDAIHNEIVLDLISKTTLDIFTLTQCLSRSSRSYCIGHFNSYEEVKMAAVHSRLVLPRFESRMETLNRIIAEGTLPNETLLASGILREKRYYVPHPIRKFHLSK